MNFRTNKRSDILCSNREIQIVLIIRIQLDIRSIEKDDLLAHNFVLWKICDNRSCLEIMILEDTRAIVNGNTDKQDISVHSFLQTVECLGDLCKLLVCSSIVNTVSNEYGQSLQL